MTFENIEASIRHLRHLLNYQKSTMAYWACLITCCVCMDVCENVCTCVILPEQPYTSGRWAKISIQSVPVCVGGYTSIPSVCVCGVPARLQTVLSVTLSPRIYWCVRICTSNHPFQHPCDEYTNTHIKTHTAVHLIKSVLIAQPKPLNCV